MTQSFQSVALLVGSLIVLEGGIRATADIVGSDSVGNTAMGGAWLQSITTGLQHWCGRRGALVEYTGYRTPPWGSKR